MDVGLLVVGLAVVMLAAVILGLIVILILMRNDSPTPIGGSGDMRSAEIEAKARSIGAQPGETNHF